MDGVLLLPPGVIVNKPGVYQEVAKFDTLPPEIIHTYWNAYTITYKKLRDPTAHRLENFWWHVWGSNCRRLSGHKLAQIYEHISTGPTFVPLRGPFADFHLPPELASYFQHSDSEPLAPNPVASGLDAAPSIPDPSKSTDKSSNYPTSAVSAPSLRPPTSSAQRPSPSLDSSSSPSSSLRSSPEQTATSISESATPNPIDEEDTDWTSDSTLKSSTGSDIDPATASSQHTSTTLESRKIVQLPIPAMSQTTMLVAPTATISVTGVAAMPNTTSPTMAASASGEAAPRSDHLTLPPSPPATTSSAVESADYDSDSNYTPIALPPPSSKRPPPKHSILKKHKSSTSSGTRHTARFASPDRSEQWRSTGVDTSSSRNKDSGNDDTNEDGQVEPVLPLPTSSSSKATASSRAPSSRAPAKKKVAVTKTSKKFAVAKKRPGLGKRSGTGSTASAHSFSDGQVGHTAGANTGDVTLIKAPVFTESPKPVTPLAPAAPVSSTSSSRPGSSKVIVHNGRPQPKTPTSSYRGAMSLSGGTLRNSPIFPPQGRLAPTPEEEEEESALIPQVVVKPEVKTYAPKKPRRQQQKKQVDHFEEQLLRLQSGEYLTNRSMSKKLAGKQPVVNNAPVIHRAVSDTSVVTAGPSRPLDSRDLGLIKVTRSGPVTKRPVVHGQRTRPPTLKSQSEIDLPTASVQATKRRLEGKTGIKSSSSMMSLSTATNGFPPRRRHSNGTDNGQPANTSEDTKHLPPFRRSHSAQSRLNAAANRAASLSHTPSYEHYTLKSTSSSAHDDTLGETLGASEQHTGASNVPAADTTDAATPRSQRLFALTTKSAELERSDLVSPATVCVSPIVAQGTVYDFDNVDVQLDMMRSRIDEPVVETDYGLPPQPPVRSVLAPMFVPTQRSNAPRVPLGRPRSQLALIMDRDSEARHSGSGGGIGVGGGGVGGKAFFSSFMPWLREQDGY